MAARKGWGTGMSATRARAMRRFPAYGDLERQARRRAPRFAFDFIAGGAGEELGVARNRAALDAIQVVPRYGIDVSRIATDVTLFGRSYALPIGIAPMGLIGLGWPRADEHMARAAQAARIPYCLSTVASLSIERAGELAPDVFWFQLYGAPAEDHALSRDMIRRAAAAGAQALVVTLDIPVRAKRLRDVRNGLVVPFRPRLDTVIDVARAPAWALSTLRHGQPRFENFPPYLPEGAGTADFAGFVHERINGPLTWDDVARFRELWPRAFLVKGILHPEDAARAVALGADGIIVSNHGGRQFEAAPATIDVVPAIVERIAGRAQVLVDGSIRSGLDVLRALGCGAQAAMAGRAFLYGVMALGEAGAAHAVELYRQELLSALGQVGARNLAEAAQVKLHHPGALAFEPDRIFGPASLREAG